MNFTRYHRSIDFKPLTYLEGAELDYHRGLDAHSLAQTPDKVTITKDYGRTVLIEMEFTKSIFGTTKTPRIVRFLIPKSSLLCGDFLVKLKDTQIFITDDIISDTIETQPIKIETLLDYALLL